MHFEIALFAYIIDRIFGEFKFIKFYKHPVVFMGDFISWFERHFYKDCVIRGAILNLSFLFFVFLVPFFIDFFIDNIFILALIASVGVASKSLYDSVGGVLENRQNIKYLVSRDTEHLSQSDINKAAIETYAENLNDGVVAPLFYLILFGLYGVFIYKGINTLDSMVGYRNETYEKYGKFSAKLDDIANFIPARITAVLIAMLFFSKKALIYFYRFGRLHESPNAGHPISAMALSLEISLGGDTSYFGKIKHKPHFGDGRAEITKDDFKKALSLQIRFDIFIILFLILGALCNIYI